MKFIYNNREYDFESYEQNDYLYNWLDNSKTFYEITLLEKLRDIVPAGIFIDLGANIGNHSVYFATQCKCQHIICVEPETHMAEVLERNLKANNISNYQIIKKAITDFTGKVKLSEVKDSTCKVVANSGDTECATIDELFGDLKGITLLKMDIEWQEVNAIKHADKFLKNNNPIIAVELVDTEIFNQFNAIIKDYGYKTNGVNYATTPTYIFTK